MALAINMKLICFSDFDIQRLQQDKHLRVRVQDAT